MVNDVLEKIELIQIPQVLRIQQRVVVHFADLLGARQRRWRYGVEAFDFPEVAQIGGAIVVTGYFVKACDLVCFQKTRNLLLFLGEIDCIFNAEGFLLSL